MPHKKLKICSAVLFVAALAIGQAQAGGKGGAPNLGASTIAPGQLPPVVGDPGKSGNAPGDIKHENDLKDAKSLAPGSKNPNKK